MVVATWPDGTERREATSRRALWPWHLLYRAGRLVACGVFEPVAVASGRQHGGVVHDPIDDRGGGRNRLPRPDARRQAPRNGASILDAARELGIRDAQETWPATGPYRGRLVSRRPGRRIGMICRVSRATFRSQAVSLEPSSVGRDRDLEKLRPVLAGDEQAILILVIGNAVQHSLGIADFARRQQAREVDPAEHMT